MSRGDLDFVDGETAGDGRLRETRQPIPLADLRAELDERISRITTRLNDYGFDPFGAKPEYARRLALLPALLYRYWFRVETDGIDRVPEGRVLLIGNHAGNTFAYDAAMLAMALLMEAEPPRLVRGMAEYYLPQLPFFGTLMHRAGSVVGTPENCIQLLEHDEAVMVFPEGAEGFVKPFSKRYQLQRFGLGFMRLAIGTDTPIVPVGIVGSEEQSSGGGGCEVAGQAGGVAGVSHHAHLSMAGARWLCATSGEVPDAFRGAPSFRGRRERGRRGHREASHGGEEGDPQAAGGGAGAAPGLVRLIRPVRKKSEDQLVT